MTKKEREALNQALKNEFLDQDEDEMRKGYREFARQLQLAQEEMGLTRYEAIIFLSTLIGNSMHK
ncbi:MAG: hypothetical protein VZQ98_09785 [Bacteroidales bacterium]|nr:hypothetical protein [Bacteroidales bacterium]